MSWTEETRLSDTYALLSAVAVALVGFWLALKQDKAGWAREKRSELYIDLLAEAYAEQQWITRTMTEAGIRMIRQSEGGDRPQRGR
jgi:hypothetical protein